MKKEKQIILNFTKLLLCLFLTFIGGCIPDKEKSEVVITCKKYCPYESGDGITSENEKYLLYVEHTNKKIFKSPIFGYTFKTMIIQTNGDIYNKLNKGDILKNKY